MCSREKKNEKKWEKYAKKSWTHFWVCSRKFFTKIFCIFGFHLLKWSMCCACGRGHFNKWNPNMQTNFGGQIFWNRLKNVSRILWTSNKFAKACSTFSAIFSLILCIFFNLEQPIFVFWDFFTRKTAKNPGIQKVNTCFCLK